MAKGLKLRFSLIHSFKFCRSKDPSSIPQSPVQATHRLSPTNSKALDISYPNVPDPPPSTPSHPFLRRRVSSKFVSVGCGCRRRRSGVLSDTSYDCDTESVEYSWKKEGRWHVISRVRVDGPRQKICYSPYSGESDGYVSPILQQPKMVKEKKLRKKKKKVTATSVRTSTSSGDSGWFSSEGGDCDEETETLVSSSRSFSNDSSYEFNPPLETISEESKSVSKPNKKNNNSKKARRLKRYVSNKWRSGSSSSSGNGNLKATWSPEAESPARVSVFQGRIPFRIDGKVRESLAVVKKSKDPYHDFKRSMLEMISEKEMYETEDLEQLLHCFLSLNSPEHHEIIVEAFAEVWEHLFSKSKKGSSCF